MPSAVSIRIASILAPTNHIEMKLSKGTRAGSVMALCAALAALPGCSGSTGTGDVRTTAATTTVGSAPTPTPVATTSAAPTSAPGTAAPDSGVPPAAWIPNAAIPLNDAMHWPGLAHRPPHFFDAPPLAAASANGVPL
jgi:hypothetical protein